jgi:hypothetical protein
MTRLAGLMIVLGVAAVGGLGSACGGGRECGPYHSMCRGDQRWACESVEPSGHDYQPVYKETCASGCYDYEVNKNAFCIAPVAECANPGEEPYLGLCEGNTAAICTLDSIAVIKEECGERFCEYDVYHQSMCAGLPGSCVDGDKACMDELGFIDCSNGVWSDYMWPCGIGTKCVDNGVDPAACI